MHGMNTYQCAVKELLRYVLVDSSVNTLKPSGNYVSHLSHQFNAVFCTI